MITRNDASFIEHKMMLHKDLINRLNLQVLTSFDEGRGREKVRSILKVLVDEYRLPLTLAETRDLVEQVVNETFGLGPLEPLMQALDVSDILVNGHDQVYVERQGKIELTDVYFHDEKHLRHVINRIVSRVGRRIDEASPMVDARLSDGSRVNAIIPPLSLGGSSLSIRRFRKEPITTDQMLHYGTFPQEFIELVKIAVKSRVNILISGGTGSGKTTLLNVLSQFIPQNERIVTIEDAAELQLRQPHTVQLETRPPNIEGSGQITQRDLFRNSLRMRPDRIIVGEVRGEESLDMLQAMNTGHDGSLTTVHANSPRDALTRIETMVLMGSPNLSQQAVRSHIASAIHLVVQKSRYSDGVRRISSFCEVTGMEGSVITLQEIMCYEQSGVDRSGRCLGRFLMRPVKPLFLKNANAKGVQLPEANSPPLNQFSRNHL